MLLPRTKAQPAGPCYTGISASPPRSPGQESSTLILKEPDGQSSAMCQNLPCPPSRSCQLNRATWPKGFLSYSWAALYPLDAFPSTSRASASLAPLERWKGDSCSGLCYTQRQRLWHHWRVRTTNALLSSQSREGPGVK